MRNLMMPILCALFLFLSGLLIINWQLWHLATLSNTHTATASTQKIDNILAEAVSAANTAKQVAAQGCTRDGQLGLGTEAALKPHLRAIMIQLQGQIICTSLPGNGVLIVNPQTLSNETLMLLPGNRLVNGIPVLIFQMPIADGRVIVSVSDAHLQDVIASATNSADMALVVGKRKLARTGDVTDWEAASWKGGITASAHFPFSVVWQPPAFSA